MELQVGYCYRERSGTATDSGWRFSQATNRTQVRQQPANCPVMYDVNTVANYDRLLPHQSRGRGSAFGTATAPGLLVPAAASGHDYAL